MLVRAAPLSAQQEEQQPRSEEGDCSHPDQRLQSNTLVGKAEVGMPDSSPPVPCQAAPLPGAIGRVRAAATLLGCTALAWVSREGAGTSLRAGGRESRSQILSENKYI